MERASGILMHITSLPGSEGIGTFGEEAYQFADFLKAAGQGYWQILPLGPVGYGNSPYQSFSAFAGNPYLIDLKTLQQEGLLAADVNIVLNKKTHTPGKVDFETIGPRKLKLLDKAYQKSLENKELQREIKKFVKKEAGWLKDYSLFMAIKESKKNKSWQQWPKPLKLREKEALAQEAQKLAGRIGFWEFVQYEFYKQWHELKNYINKCGIKVIGDIPIYVAADSSDTWANPQLFKLDETCQPVTVAGCPPDDFCEDGQLWGNPIYDWAYHEKTHYKWWIQRIEQNAASYDVIRIDHFRGFEAFWEVPAKEETARNGKWTKGPGYQLFEAIQKSIGKVEIIAEDLGFLTEDVKVLREKTGYPGMAVLEFAFDPKGESQYLPHNCQKDSVIYIGTHDNETIMGWITNPEHKKEFNFAKRYLRLSKRENYNWGFIRAAWASPSVLAIAQMQDLLGLDNEARMNTPSTVGDNWNWQMKEHAIDQKMITKLKQLTKLYGRRGKENGK